MEGGGWPIALLGTGKSTWQCVGLDAKNVSSVGSDLVTSFLYDKVQVMRLRDGHHRAKALAKVGRFEEAAEAYRRACLA